MVTVGTACFNIAQDGRCTYNVTLRSVRATVTAMETQKYIN
jgi:hypothetical protein